MMISQKISQKSSWLLFTIFYCLFISADLIIEHRQKEIWIPMRILSSLILIIYISYHVRSAIMKNKLTIHGLLLVVSLISSMGGDVFAIFKGEITTGFSMGLYFTSRLLLVLIHTIQIWKSSATSSFDLKLTSLIPFIFSSIVVISLVNRVSKGDLLVTSAYLMVISLATCQAVLCQRHLISGIYKLVLIGTSAIMAYDLIFLFAKYNDWQRRDYYYPLMGLNYLAWLLVAQGGVDAIHHYDICDEIANKTLEKEENKKTK